MIYDWQYEEAEELGIKPCQCGGAAIIREIGNAHTKKRCVEMECTKCHIKRNQCILNHTGGLSFEDLKAGVINDWNTRPVEDRLKEALDRQCDNMAFVLNRVNLHGFHDKFDAELTEDRKLL